MRSSTGRSFIPVGDVGIEGDEHAQTSLTLCTAGWGWSGLAGDARRRCPTTRSRGCYDEDDSGWRNAPVVPNLGRRGRGESSYGATDLVPPWAEVALGGPCSRRHSRCSADLPAGRGRHLVPVRGAGILGLVPSPSPAWPLLLMPCRSYSGRQPSPAGNECNSTDDGSGRGRRHPFADPPSSSRA